MKNFSPRDGWLYPLVFFSLILISVAAFWVQRRQDDPGLEQIDRRFAAACLQRYGPVNETPVDAIRDCVHKSTMFAMDEEFYQHWGDKAYMASAALDYLEGRRTQRPHFECSTRAGLMLRALRTQGVEAREIIIARFVENFLDHVVIGIPRGNDENWEVHDPSYNVYFMRPETGTRAGALDLLRSDLEKLIPCETKTRCGWDLVSADKFPATHLYGLWGMMAYREADKTWKLVYNRDKFDPYKEIAGLSYCEKRKKHCEFPPREVNGR